MRQKFKKVTRVTPSRDPPGHYSTANSLSGPRGAPDPSEQSSGFRNRCVLSLGAQLLLSHPMTASRMTAFHLFWISKENDMKNLRENLFRSRVPDYRRSFAGYQQNTLTETKG